MMFQFLSTIQLCYWCSFSEKWPTQKWCFGWFRNNPQNHATLRKKIAQFWGWFVTHPPHSSRFFLSSKMFHVQHIVKLILIPDLLLCKLDSLVLIFLLGYFEKLIRVTIKFSTSEQRGSCSLRGTYFSAPFH